MAQQVLVAGDAPGQRRQSRRMKPLPSVAFCPIAMNLVGGAQVSFLRQSRRDLLAASITARDPSRKSRFYDRCVGSSGPSAYHSYAGAYSTVIFNCRLCIGKPS
jgi:hypothetical protein